MNRPRKQESSPGCARFEPLIDLMIDGELEAQRTAGVQEHLRGCPRCRRIRRDILRLRDTLGAQDSRDLSTDFVSRVKETLFEGAEPQPKLVSSRGRTPRRQPQLASMAVYAAMLMIGCFFAFGAYRFGRMHESQSALELAQHKVVPESAKAEVKLDKKSPSRAADFLAAADDSDEESNSSKILATPPLAKKKPSTPLLDEAMRSAQDEAGLGSSPPSEDDLFDSDIPTEDVILSSTAKEVLESCETMAAVRREVSAAMPMVEGGMLHADPLVMNLAETTFDLEYLLKKGLLVPGSKLIVPDDMRLVFEIKGNGVHLRIEVDQLKDQKPRINVIDMSNAMKKALRRSKKPAIKKLKLR